MTKYIERDWLVQDPDLEFNPSDYEDCDACSALEDQCTFHLGVDVGYQFALDGFKGLLNGMMNDVALEDPVVGDPVTSIVGDVVFPTVGDVIPTIDPVIPTMDPIIPTHSGPSDHPRGPGWWQASDGHWYSPDFTPASILVRD